MRQAITVVLGGLFLAGPVCAGDLPVGNPEQGRKLTPLCRTCHGTEGLARIPIAPHIGGEPAEYLARQLLAFRDGTRKHEMMSVVAQSLQDVQIADLAAWYATPKLQVALGAAPEAAPAACVKCHGADGVSVVEDAPNLAGESTIYIETQLKAFQNGSRQNQAMTPVARELTPADMRSVAAWYAAIQIEILPMAE